MYSLPSPQKTPQKYREQRSLAYGGLQGSLWARWGEDFPKGTWSLAKSCIWFLGWGLDTPAVVWGTRWLQGKLKCPGKGSVIKSMQTGNATWVSNVFCFCFLPAEKDHSMVQNPVQWKEYNICLFILLNNLRSCFKGPFWFEVVKQISSSNTVPG